MDVVLGALIGAVLGGVVGWALKAWEFKRADRSRQVDKSTAAAKELTRAILDLRDAWTQDDFLQGLRSSMREWLRARSLSEPALSDDVVRDCLARFHKLVYEVAYNSDVLEAMAPRRGSAQYRLGVAADVVLDALATHRRGKSPIQCPLPHPRRAFAYLKSSPLTEMQEFADAPEPQEDE